MCADSEIHKQNVKALRMWNTKTDIKINLFMSFIYFFNNNTPRLKSILAKMFSITLQR